MAFFIANKDCVTESQAENRPTASQMNHFYYEKLPFQDKIVYNFPKNNSILFILLSVIRFIHMHLWMQAHMQAQTHIMYSRIQNLVK